jgi:cytoskeletal protein CcmA (bactofilin family)
MRFKFTLLTLLSAFAFQVQAINFITTNTYHIAKDQVVGDEQWVLANRIETEGTFRNDIFITSGNELKLHGIYEGNIWGAASEGAIMDGRSERNVRLTGKTVKINGHVGGNVMAMADTIIVGTNAVIKGNVRLFATSIIQEGLIHGNASITSARVVTLGGTIEGNVHLNAQDVLFSREAKIWGDLSYTANKELLPSEGVVEGKLERIQPKAEPLFSRSRLTSRALWFFAAFLAGVPFITLFPMTTAMASQLVRKSTWKCLLIGFLASGALPIFGIMSLSSIIGIPLGTLLLASWGIMLYLSRIIMGLVLGTLILKSGGSSIGRVLTSMALGLAIIYLATIIPSIGIPVQMTVIWLGMGSLILALLEKRRLIIQVPQNLQKLEELRNEKFNPEEK